MYKYATLHNSSLPHFALIPALAYLLYVATATIYASGNPESTALQTPEAELLGQEIIEIKPMDFLVIKDWHLFGEAAVLPTQTSEQHDTPQETQLQLKLLGVFFLPDQNNASYAIIEAEDHLQKKYRSGDQLPGGITLQSIAQQQVMLLRNQQRESLSMDRKKTESLLKTQ